MNTKLFFEIARAEGVEQSQLFVSKSKKLSFSLFHHEIDSFHIAETQGITAMGIYKGKLGSSSTESGGRSNFEYLVKNIKETASLIEKDSIGDLFKGSEKYHKRNIYDKRLEEIPTEEKIALLKEIEKDLFAADPRITEVAGLEYEESFSAKEFHNSFGVKLSEKSNYFVIVAEVVAKQGEETKVGVEIDFGTDLKAFNKQKFVQKAVKNAIDKFGGTACPSAKYPTVLDRTIVSALLSYYLSSASAEEVQKKSSLFEGKLGQKIASSKLTVWERPLAKNIFFTYFDDEGVATQNKTVIDKGVLKTYFHNRETAKKDGVESTGNASWGGGKFGIGFLNVFVKGGKKSFDEMIAPIKLGVYINDIAGLGTGMNPASGDFSCQAEGFMIRDGKLAEPLNLITLSGNLMKMFDSIRDLDNRVELQVSATSCPDLYIKSMNIGGK